MPVKDNVIHARFFGNDSKIKIRRGWRYDYGMVLEFSGLSLPQTFEVHFSNSRTAPAKTAIGTDNRVLIPDEYFTGADVIYAWLYLHSGTDDGYTAFEVEILLSARPTVTNEQPTPVEQSVIEQTIAALNTAVELSETNVEHYPTIVNGEWYVWDAESGVFVSTGVLAAGQDGADGEDGYTPIKGVDYFDGAKGDKGDKGEKGDTGSKGDTGAKGDTGPQGPKGDKGDTGATGPKGDKGDTGATGAKGDKGDPGQNGQDGEDGADGADGTTFTPAVSSAGVISWTNDGGKQNPSSVDLVAAVINALPGAVGVSF